MDVCACHISPLDVKQNNRSGSANGFSLKQEAKLRSQEYLALHDVPDRISPIKRSEGFDNPLAKHYCQMADDNMELLLQAQSQAYEAKLDSGVEDLCLVIAQLKKQAAAAAESFQAASHGQQALLMAVSDASVAAKLDAESATQSALIEASKALDAVVHSAALAAKDAKDALAAAKESVDFISSSIEANNVATFDRLRLAANKIASEFERAGTTFSWTHDTVKIICDNAEAPFEYVRFLSMFNPKRSSIAQGTATGTTETTSLKAKCREKRAISAFFIAIGATSERFSILRNAVDSVLHVPRSKQAVASNMGFMPSLSTADRQDKILLNDYGTLVDEIFSKWLDLPLNLSEDDLEKFLRTWTPTHCLFGWFDDFVWNRARAVFRSAEQRSVRITWAVIAVKKGNVAPSRPLSFDHNFRDPIFLNVPLLLEHVRGPILSLGPRLYLADNVDYLQFPATLSIRSNVSRRQGGKQDVFQNK